MFALALLAVIIGSTLQRASGTGVGLVVAPALALVYGPAQGVLLTNATTMLSGLLLTLSVRPQVDWQAYRTIALWSLPGACAGASLVQGLPAQTLQIVIGSIVLTALMITLFIPQLPHIASIWSRRIAGCIGGCFNTTAGVAAPAMVVYANLSRWEQKSFAATMQPTFMTMGLVSVILKSIVFPVPNMNLPPWWLLPAIAATVFCGSHIGNIVATKLSAHTARRIAIGCALIGGLVVLIRGLGWIS